MQRWIRPFKEPEEAERMAKEFKAATLLRERLVAMLEEDVQSSIKEMRKFIDQDRKNLTEAYATELAKQQAILDVIKLLR